MIRRLAATLVLILAGLAVAGPPIAAASSAPIGGVELGSAGVVVPARAPALPGGISSKSFVLADAGTGAVLAARDPHGRYLPASTLKTLTALTLLPRLADRRRVVAATRADVAVDGTRVGLVAGGRYTVSLLFECMLMMSGNDCANALARSAGSVASTLAQMDARARFLHADDTHANTPSGLDAPGESTSAYDLALILRADIAIPDFVRYNSTLTSEVPAQPPKYGAFAFANDNDLRKHHYPGLIAAKNGYTDAARHTFVAAAGRGGRRLVVTLMHGEQSPVPMWRQAASLLTWGFALPQGTPPVGTLVPPGSAPPTRSSRTAAPTQRPVQHRLYGVTGAAARPDRSPQRVRFLVIGLVALGGLIAVGGGVLRGRRRSSG